MSGFGWIASYALLSIVVVWQTVGLLMIASRYRELHRSQRRRLGIWPSLHFRPGDQPKALSKIVHEVAGNRSTLLVLGRSDDELLYASVKAAAEVALQYDLALVTAVSRIDQFKADRSTVTLRDLAAGSVVAELEPEAFEGLGLIATPATIYWNAGIVDAAVGFGSPSQLLLRYAAYLNPSSIYAHRLGEELSVVEAGRES